MDGSSSAPAIQQLGILHLAACAALLVTVVVASGVLRLGLLWHVLDIVWIGIFSVVYLGGLA